MRFENFSQSKSVIHSVLWRRPQSLAATIGHHGKRQLQRRRNSSIHAKRSDICCRAIVRACSNIQRAKSDACSTACNHEYLECHNKTYEDYLRSIYRDLVSTYRRLPRASKGTFRKLLTHLSSGYIRIRGLRLNAVGRRSLPLAVKPFQLFRVLGLRGSR